MNAFDVLLSPTPKPAVAPCPVCGEQMRYLARGAYECYTNHQAHNGWIISKAVLEAAKAASESGRPITLKDIGATSAERMFNWRAKRLQNAVICVCPVNDGLLIACHDSYDLMVKKVVLQPSLPIKYVELVEDEPLPPPCRWLWGWAEQVKPELTRPCCNCCK